MIKLIDILKEDEEQKPNKIFVPRRVDNRKEKLKQIEYQKIQKYIENGCKGDLHLSGLTLTKLPDNLTRVGGKLFLNDSKIEDLNNLRYVGDSLFLVYSQISSLPKNLKVKHNVWIDESTPLAQKYTKEQIEKMCPGIGGDVIYYD